MSKEMLINTVEGQECRIAIVSNNELSELYIERVSSASHVGNIYKGRITNVEPSIQAAFVDFGLTKNGFLHISDVNPSYFPRSRRSTGAEAVGRKKGHRDRPPIQECLRRGQEVVVQLTKEGIGTKGPTMTTYLSIPGRLLVMMPGMSRLGVSRKIEDDEARDKARAILADLKPPEDIGFIVRTAGIDRPKREFQRDLNYLLRLWKSVKHRIQTSKAPIEIYQESDLVTRTIRDIYNADIDRIICDNQEVALKVREFLDVAMPRTRNMIELYTGIEGLFHEYGLDQEIENIYSRRLELPSGGSLIFDQAEALVAIDVNSGRFREHTDAETTATKINCEAAREIARQLRLRDLGGVIIIDFIDMREDRNRRAVEKVLRDEVRNDRAKTKIIKISNFGIVEMTRQRVRPSLKQSIFRTCNHCQGTGLIKNEESQALLVMRNLQRACANDQVAQVEVNVTPSVEHHLANHERKRLSELEAQTGKRIILRSDSSLVGSEVKIECTNSRGSHVAWEQAIKPTGPEARKLSTISLDEVVPPGPPVEYEDLVEFPMDEELPEVQEQVVPEVAQRPDRRRPSPRPPEVAPAVEAPAPNEALPQAAAPVPVAPELSAGQPEAAQGEVLLGPDGQPKKRRRGRRGGRRHRARRERQIIAEQAAGAPTAPGEPADVPAVSGPTEEEELSEARSLAREQQEFVPAAQAAPEPAAAAVDVPTPTVAEPQETTIPSEEPPAKKKRRRGGRRHKKAAPAKDTEASVAAGEPAEQAPEKQPAPKPVPETEAAPEATKAPAASEAPAAPPAKKVRVRRKATGHTQDKEYYEETVRRQKEAVRKPKDAIPDEDEEDFTRE